MSLIALSTLSSPLKPYENTASVGAPIVGAKKQNNTANNGQAQDLPLQHQTAMLSFEQSEPTVDAQGVSLSIKQKASALALSKGVSLSIKQRRQL